MNPSRAIAPSSLLPSGTARKAPPRIGGAPALRQGFTLLEMLLGVAVFAVVMVAVHVVFHGAIRLRNTSAASFDNALPLQQAIARIKRDLANLAPPGGTLTGTLQTAPTTASTTGLAHPGTPVSPAFYTTSGALHETSPWSELRKVTYFLVPPTNFAHGRQLVRSVTRNLLPVLTEEFESQALLENVGDFTFEFHDGTQWLPAWDSTSGDGGLPAGIRASLTLLNPETGVPDPAPVEIIVPILTQGAGGDAAPAGEGQ